MPAKTKERYYIFLALLEAIRVALVRTVYGLLDILAVMASFLFDTRTLKKQTLRHPAHPLHTARSVARW